MKYPFIHELLKGVTEGNVSYRVWRGKTTEHVIGKKTVFFTLAEENSYKLATELQRRFVLLRTGESEAVTRAILEKKAESQLQQKQNFSLKDHLAACLHLPYAVVNPFLPYLLHYVPPVLKARSYADHIIGMMKASTLFHHPLRFRHGRTLFASIDDVHAMHHYYWDDFCRSLGCESIPLDMEDCLEQGKAVMAENN